MPNKTGFFSCKKLVDFSTNFYFRKKMNWFFEIFFLNKGNAIIPHVPKTYYIMWLSVENCHRREDIYEKKCGFNDACCE